MISFGYHFVSARFSRLHGPAEVCDFDRTHDQNPVVQRGISQLPCKETVPDILSQQPLGDFVCSFNILHGGFMFDKLTENLGGIPGFNFRKMEIGGKMKNICVPNKYMRELQSRFLSDLKDRVHAQKGNDFFALRKLLSATGSVKGTNSIVNAQKHMGSNYFYITDLVKAFPNIDLERLAALLIYIYKANYYRIEFDIRYIGQNYQRLFDDEDFQQTLVFLKRYLAGQYQQGLAIGGPASPYLLNIYMEAYLDVHLRRFCENNDKIVYTRYVDDLVFSRPVGFIGKDTRKAIRSIIERVGLKINHRKSKVLWFDIGQVAITKTILSKSEDEVKLKYPQEKRRKLHGMIGSYLHMQMDHPEVVSGHIAGFLHYYKNVKKPTRTDEKTFSLCKRFEEAWTPYKSKHSYTKT